MIVWEFSTHNGKEIIGFIYPLNVVFETTLILILKIIKISVLLAG